jgi:hypothetical protein
MEKELTEEELLTALKTCADSAPGSDGIPYSVYKKLWSITGSYILKAWSFSCATGSLPPSHKESIITLLPKEGKDLKDIKNWRPITLSNCDSKIITKALSMKISKVLDEIIDVNQTAYVNGRAVADNLRSIMFMKEKCAEEKIESILVSLDAKKAFDSVSHKYIEVTLRKYGFGEEFINCFKTLYKDLTAKILINGHMSIMIKILKGVKQGDALSCALFIICIDPLLRNINKDVTIKKIDLELPITHEKVDYKAGCYADDVDVACGADQASIQGIFKQYEKLTKKSGLELNADKTEIIALHTERTLHYEVQYNGQIVKISTMKEMKICGIWYCTDKEREYELNITEKIKKLEHKIKLWRSRNLTFEGKILIIKTFGLSQLIYNLQVQGINDSSIKQIERIIFGFIWLNSRSEKEKGIDRIKRSILKNETAEGGLNVTDVECLNRALKLRQYIRANKTNHPIKQIQKYCTEKLGYSVDGIQQEYNKTTKSEAITESAQTTINIIHDHTLKKIISDSGKHANNMNTIKYAASININTHLLRCKKRLVQCVFIPLRNEGIEKLHEICREEETERERQRLKRIRMVIVNFPVELIEMASSYDEDVNAASEGITHILIKEETWKELEKITTKEIQKLLKEAMNKITKQDFDSKLGIENFDKNNITKFRHHCKNVKLRHIYYRLISRDFFTMEKMLKYKMVTSDKCQRCNGKETLKHLLWDCVEAKKLWKAIMNISKKLIMHKVKFKTTRKFILLKI